MNSIQFEKVSVRLISLGSIAVTIFMISNGVTDPVNVPKFFILGSIGTGCAALLLTGSWRNLWFQQRPASIAAVLFLCGCIGSVIFSQAPLTQNLYGAYGRNNGAIAYISLTFLFLLSAGLVEKKSFSMISNALLISGFLNVLYCSWVLLFGDFMGWNNQYNNLLGTFGNPNFIGSFLSIYASAAFAYVVSAKTKNSMRILLGASALIAIFEMLSTNVMQGKVVLVLGIALVLGALIRAHTVNGIITWAYFTVIVTLGLTAVLGMLQQGPLAKYIYQYTVSLRGEYWKAGIKTGQEHLFTGVGFDAFGDWYRRTRSAKALITPGVDVTVNTAHNVVIDIFAFGGLPLLIPYIALLVITLITVVKVFTQKKIYDPIFVSLSVGWIGYQAQSVISINQLGLAIWGWVLSGALLGYSHYIIQVSKSENQDRGSKRISSKKVQAFSPGLIVSLGMVGGAIISAPPLSADMNFRSAQVSQNAEKMQESLVEKYMHPQNTNNYLNAVIAFEQAGLNDQALAISQVALKFNPNSFETWRALYFLRNSSPQQREVALENMKRLDPRNRNLTEPPK